MCLRSFELLSILACFWLAYDVEGSYRICNGFCPILKCKANRDCFLRLCTESSGTIGCKDEGHVLKITNFWFGRIGNKICEPGIVREPNCQNATIHQRQLENGKRLCDNETTCSFKAYFDEKDTCGYPLWSDPCEATPKYIDVNFTCIEKPSHNYFGEWQGWSLCSSTCGSAKQVRKRECLEPANKECTPSTCEQKRLDESFNSNFEEYQDCLNNPSCPEVTDTTTTLYMTAGITETSSVTPTLTVPSSLGNSKIASSSFTTKTAIIGRNNQTKTISYFSTPKPRETLSLVMSSMRIQSTTVFVDSSRKDRSLLVSKSIQSTEILPPILVKTTHVTSSIPPTTASPPPTKTTDVVLVYGKVTINLVWKKFCENSKTFREGIATLLHNKTNKDINYTRIIIYNENNCRDKSDSQTIVIFYVRKKTSNVPDKDLTRIAVEGLIELIRDGKTGDLGEVFKGDNMIMTVVYVNEEKDTWKLWLILGIVAIFLLTIIFCCLYRLCSKKNKAADLYKVNSIEKKPLTPDIEKKQPIEKADEPDETPNRYTSTISVTVRPTNKMNGKENPAYATDENADAPIKFKPINVQLVNMDMDEETKSDASEDKQTKIFVDGKLQENIPMDEINSKR